MMNGVGGSVIHWGGALRRYHPHHFKYRTYVRERWGEQALPEGHTLSDWPFGYDELEPYYTQLEYQIGVAGDGGRNPFVPRSKPLPAAAHAPVSHGRESSARRPTRLGCTPIRRRWPSTACRTTAFPRPPTAPGAAGSARSTTSAGIPA